MSANPTAGKARRRTFTVPVRRLVEFVLRTGDLSSGSGGWALPDRALQGTRAHQRLQQERPAQYRAEVPVTARFSEGPVELVIRGRVDGFCDGLPRPIVEEIKSVRHTLPEAVDPMHAAQAKVYAALLAEAHDRAEWEVQVTYVELQSGWTRSFKEICTREQLHAFFKTVQGSYLNWIVKHAAWCELRDRSLDTLPFPFSTVRAGQEELTAHAERALADGRRLFVEAPTGIGKTVALLWPALRAIEREEIERVYFLTAKTVGRLVAAKAFADLRSAGARVRVLTLTAREKLCFNEGNPCDVRQCPYARGYYDRSKRAIEELLAFEALDRIAIETVARAHQVCPYQLAVDASDWVDAVIGDYNYAFDPGAQLARWFAPDSPEFALLLDEAHNLIERGREMFSARLDSHELSEMARGLRLDLPRAARLLDQAVEMLIETAAAPDPIWGDAGALVRNEPPRAFVDLLLEFLTEAEAWLAQAAKIESARPVLVAFYFQVRQFTARAEAFGPEFVSIVRPQDQGIAIDLYCVDPSRLLREVLKEARTTILFSATLTPARYFQSLLGEGERDLVARLSSPFPPGNFGVLIEGSIGTAYKARQSSYPKVAGAISRFVSARAGNYIVFFPSYDYLNQVAAGFEPPPGWRFMAQTPRMSEGDREEFLNAFKQEGQQRLVAFALMGGIFGEGIDLLGEELVGAVVVGVGLPLLCLERNLIRRYHDEQGENGFDYAYVFPGVRRVFQAAGRVIRSETDRGLVLLIDPRFKQHKYRELFPGWWDARVVHGAEEVAEAAAEFWATAPLEALA